MDRRCREGSLNPMWGKSHTQATKKKISKSQQERYNAIRKALKEDVSGEDEATDRKIIERLNAMLQDGTITTVSELDNAIYLLFYCDIANRIIREVKHKLREYGEKKARHHDIYYNT